MPRFVVPPAATLAPPEDGSTPSKTRRKAASHALQDVGKALVALDPSRLADLGLPERLTDAVLAARGIRAHEGRRRQMQYIGKLMREIDAEPVLAALAQIAAGKPTDQAEVTAAETWREALLRDEGALPRLLAAFPHADAAAFATLVRETRAERTRSGPPHRYRELFRRLKALAAKRPASGAPDAPADE